MSRRMVSLVLAIALAGAFAAAAQVQTVTVPNVSQRATVSQRIGLTDVMRRVLLLAGGCATGRSVPPETAPQPAPLFENLGDHRFPVTTSSPLAQRYVDLGTPPLVARGSPPLAGLPGAPRGGRPRPHARRRSAKPEPKRLERQPVRARHHRLGQHVRFVETGLEHRGVVGFLPVCLAIAVSHGPDGTIS